MESSLPTKMNHKSLTISGKSLGAGGFSTVFMGQLDEEEVAAKRLSQSESEFENLVREASRLKKLQYGKHIAYTHGIILKDGSLYMIMEYSEHGDLQSYLIRNKESVTYEQKILFCRGILLGLMYCHSMNIFHGDIKCSNVILGKNLEPKLTDFGLSMTVDNIEHYSKLYDGSLYWVAPELLSIKEDEAVYQEFIADPYPCDVYSLRATFCEISYDGTTEFIDSDNPGTDIMLELVSPTPKEAFLEEIVKHCCQFERNERISLENCFSMLENITEEQFPIPAVDDKWQLIQQDIKANSKLKLPPLFILHRPAENLVVGLSNLLLLEWLCINNCIDSVKYMVQLHGKDQDQIKWLYEISELCKSLEVASFLQKIMQNSEPSRLVLSSLIDNHPQQFIEILIKAGASSYSYTLLKKAIERCHNITVQAIVDSRNYIENRAAYDAVKFGNAEAVKILANTDVDLEWSDYYNGYTPLTIAIETENIEIVKILLEHGVDANSENYYTKGYMGVETQHRPLNLAALKDNREIVKLLINAGATMDITSSSWHSLSQSLEQQGNISMVHFILNCISKRSSSVKNNPLCTEIQNKHLDIVQKLISNKEKIDEIGLDGYSPLHWAVIVDDEEIIKNLIRAGADLDVRTSNELQKLHSVLIPDYFKECTPLHIAVSKRHLGIARLLIEAGADFSAKNGLRQTIMDIVKEIEKIIMECAPVDVISIQRAMKSMSHESVKIMINKQVNVEILSECFCIAASSGKNDIVKYLLQCGVNINKVYQDKTPLWWAIFWGNIEAMNILVNAGANLNIKNWCQETPLLQCVKESDTEMVQFLVDKGADVNASGEDEYASIHFIRDKKIAEILTNAGADINAEDQYGETPLIHHARNSNAEMVQFLVDKGADINARDENGNASIQYANDQSILRILINAGADINMKNKYRETCLIQHVKKSDTEMVQFLVNQGADVNARDKYGNAPIHNTDDKDIFEILINAGADINAGSCFGETPLIGYVREYDAEMVQFLVDKEADVNARDKYGNAPIHYTNDKDIFEILINAGADINAKDRYGITPLFQCVKKSQLDIVQFLVDKGVDINAIDKDGNVPIYYVNDNDILKIFINAGADFNVKNQRGIAFLIQNVKNSNTEMVQFLVNQGVDVNASDKDGKTSFHYVNSKDVLEILIHAGADVNAKAQYGITCLIQSVKESDTKIVQFLVNQGVDVNARDQDGNLPIYYAENKEIIGILINAGADINAKNCYGRVCLMHHVKRSDIEMVQLLLDKRADVNARDEGGNTSIHYVNNKDVLEILFNAGADINAKGQYGITPLFQCVKKSQLDIVRFLVDKGVDINARDKDGNAPIHYVNNKDVLQILLNAGADINAKGQYRITRLIQYVKKSQLDMVQFLVNQGADVNASDEDGNASIHFVRDKEIAKILITAGTNINIKNKHRKVLLNILIEEQNKNLSNNQYKRRKVCELLEYLRVINKI